MSTSAIPYEQWALNYLDHGTAKVEYHRNETLNEVEMIETYIDEA